MKYMQSVLNKLNYNVCLFNNGNELFSMCHYDAYNLSMKQLWYSPNLSPSRAAEPIISDQKYINLKNQVIKAERRLLKELGFCVHVKHPHKVNINTRGLLAKHFDKLTSDSDRKENTTSFPLIYWEIKVFHGRRKKRRLFADVVFFALITNERNWKARFRCYLRGQMRHLSISW